MPDPAQPHRLIHLDDDLLVVDKPAGLLSVPGRGPDKQDCLSQRVQAQVPGALVVHRLDMATSGLLLFARGLAAQRALNRAFEHRQVHKIYRAVVHGVPLQDHGSIDLPLIADWPRRPRQIVDLQQGKPALTHWRRLQLQSDGASPMELRPITGRSHQLRVHMAAIGHPILGDDLYAHEQACAMAPRLLLHACQLTVLHPHTQEPLSFYSAAPF